MCLGSTLHRVPPPPARCTLGIRSPPHRVAWRQSDRQFARVWVITEQLTDSPPSCLGGHVTACPRHSGGSRGSEKLNPDSKTHAKFLKLRLVPLTPKNSPSRHKFWPHWDSDRGGTEAAPPWRWIRRTDRCPGRWRLRLRRLQLEGSRAAPGPAPQCNGSGLPRTGGVVRCVHGRRRSVRGMRGTQASCN